MKSSSSGLWARLLAPDLALLAAIVTLCYCLFLFDGGRKLFRDSDTGWHIRTGEAIMAGRVLPRADPYSFTRNGHTWFAWEWGADVIMGAGHRMDGLRGVALVFLLAIAATTWLWVRLHWAAGGNFLMACLLASPMLSTVNLHWLARPHVFSWLFLLAAVWIAERPPDRLRLWHAALALAGGGLWANLHASFFLAPVIALTYALAHLLRPLVWDLDGAPERRKAGWFLCMALCSLLGSLLNPYGFQMHGHVFNYLANKELLARVGEFQSFNFHAEGAFQILLTVGLAGLGGVLALSQKRLGHFLLAVLLIAVALRSARGLPVVALLLLPLANGTITAALRDWGGLHPAVRRRLDSFLRYSGNLRLIDTRFRGWALVPLLVLLVLACLRLPAVAARIGFPPEEFPVAAAEVLDKLPQDIRLLAPDKYGGYLIYRFAGRRKVFFDGRSDFYGTAYMKAYIRLVEVRPGWRQQVQEFGFTHALLPNQYSLVAALEQAGWKRLYGDSVTTLLERP